ncbi:hypothetical protein ACFL2Q_06870 [Thermodesulfobacteriota bacterium]
MAPAKKKARSKKRTVSKADSEQYNTIDITEIKKHSTFENLLPIDKDLLENITLDMRQNGYYESKPVVLANWPGLEGFVLADGHARVRAAFEADIAHVPFVTVEFPDEVSALQHAMSLQTKRRTTTDGALYRLCAQFDRLNERGGDRRSKKTKSMPTRDGIDPGRSASARKTASLIGSNFRKVEKIRKILKDGTPEIQEALKNDKLTINAAYMRIRKMKTGAVKKNSKEESSAKQVKAAKLVLNRENFEGLNALGGDLSSQLNLAVEQFISGLRDKERAEEPARETAT